jgi:hypothetical protein
MHYEHLGQGVAPIAARKRQEALEKEAREKEALEQKRRAAGGAGSEFPVVPVAIGAAALVAVLLLARR